MRATNCNFCENKFQDRSRRAQVAPLSANDCKFAQDTLLGQCIKNHVACMMIEIFNTSNITLTGRRKRT